MRRSASTAGQRRMEVVAPTVRPKNTSMAQATASVGGVDRNHQEADALTALQRLMRNRLLIGKEALTENDGRIRLHRQRQFEVALA